MKVSSKTSSVQLLVSVQGVAILLLAAQVCWASDPFVAFAKARNTFEAGDYAEAANRFEEFFDTDPDVPALVIEAHKYLAISYLFLGNRQDAEDQFIHLLTRNTEYALDPLVFPMDVVDFFTEVKRAHATQLDRIAFARKRAEAERKKEEERQRQLTIEKLRTHVYLEKQVRVRSPVVALVPFGAGQFQNGHHTKGWILLSGQVILLTSSIVTFALHQQLRQEAASPFARSSDRRQFETRERAIRVTNHTSLISLAALAVIGVVDAMVHFSLQDISFRVLEETEVPIRHRKKKTTPVSFHPTLLTLNERTIQMDLTIRF